MKGAFSQPSNVERPTSSTTSEESSLVKEETLGCAMYLCSRRRAHTGAWHVRENSKHVRGTMLSAASSLEVCMETQHAVVLSAGRRRVDEEAFLASSDDLYSLAKPLLEEGHSVAS